MDVCLVLTHRCNLACHYCYAGEHHRRQMDDRVVDRAVDLLYSDGADTAQLSFFGGEPFLRLDAMQRAVERARQRAAERDARLLLQCTTNGTVLDEEAVRFVRESGMRVTVSIDGIKEAHDLHRPRAGGGSSFDQCVRGLRGLVAAGAQPDALMVISPQTVPYVYRSVSWLWSEGAMTVRANCVLDADWRSSDRDELREQLWAVASEMVARRQRGEPALFEPFAAALRRGRAQRGPAVPARRERQQIVVATEGNLYPCAPMVGEDREVGPEAALRIGHLDDGAARIAGQVSRRGAGCDAGGKACACAAYLETGDRDTAGPNGLWYGRMCDELGTAAAAALAQPRRLETGRRPFLIGLAAALGGASIGVPALSALFGEEEKKAGCKLPVTTDPPPDVPPPPGQMLAPPPPPPETDVAIDGGLRAPPEPEIVVKGNMKAPEPEVRVRGDFASPAGIDDDIK
jgi:uncharacterized protein